MIRLQNRKNVQTKQDDWEKVVKLKVRLRHGRKLQCKKKVCSNDIHGKTQQHFSRHKNFLSRFGIWKTASKVITATSSSLKKADTDEV
jgi:hypothetical protein